MFYYAQLDENNICMGKSQLTGEVQQDNMIKLISGEEDVISKKYENGKWSEEKFIVEHVKTYDELRREYIRLIQEAELLGEDEESLRLKAEWKEVKNRYETENQ